MFKILNIYTKRQLELSVSHGGEEIIFNIKSLISKRNKDELGDHQFTLLEEYIDYKGSDFKDSLFSKYVAAYTEITMSIGRTNIIPLPYSMVHNILDMFDVNDIFYWMKNIRQFKALSGLDDVFDESRVIDGRGTRVQTYIKDDYLYLASLIMVMKTVIGPIGQYADMYTDQLTSHLAAYTLFNFISTHPIYQSEPFVKLYGQTEIIVAVVTREASLSALSVIEHQVPKDSLVDWVLANTVLHRIVTFPIITDTNNDNIITKSYSFINNKMKIKGDVSKKLRIKDAEGKNNDASLNESESVLETYRIVSELAPAMVVELDWAVSNLAKNPHLLYPDIDLNLYDNVKRFTARLKDVMLTKSQIQIIGWITKGYIDSRALNYIKLESIISLTIISFCWLWQHNFKYLALWITSSVLDDTYDDSMVISMTTNRTRITTDLKEELDRLFPYKKVIVTKNENKEVNLCVIDINNISADIFKRRWVFTADTEYIVEATGSPVVNIAVPADLKVQLSKLIIELNK